MKTGLQGISLIRQFEGCRLDSYQDQKGIWTIGFGSTDGVCAGMRITFEEALQKLQAHLEPLEKEISALVKVPLSQNQFDALVCLSYNIGIGNFEHSLLLRCLNTHHFDDAAGEFLKWDRLSGIPDRGLLRRREAERELFMKGSV